MKLLSMEREEYMDISKRRFRFILKHKRFFSALCLIVLMFPVYFIYTQYHHIEEQSIMTEVNDISDRLERYYQESLEELDHLRIASSSFASFNEVRNYLQAPSHSNFEAFLEQRWIKEILNWPLLEKITFYDAEGRELITADLSSNQAPKIVETRTRGEVSQRVLRLGELEDLTIIESNINNDRFGLCVFNKVIVDNKLLGYYCVKVDMHDLLGRIEHGHQYEFPLLLINDKGNILLDYYWDNNITNSRRYSETLEALNPQVWDKVAYHSWTNFYKEDHFYYVYRYFDFPLTRKEYQLAAITRISENIIQATLEEYLDPILLQAILLMCLCLSLTFPFYFLWRTGETFVLEEELKKLPMQSSTPIVITDHKHEVVMINDAALMLFDTTYDQVKGRDPYKLDHLKPISLRQIKEQRSALAEKGEWSGKLAMRKENGEIVDELINVRRVDGANGMAKYHIGIFYDIHQHTEHLNELKNQVEIDSLTGCYSRAYFYKKLEKELEFVKQHSSEYKSSVILVHLENFSSYSRHYGHQEGDLLLAYIGKLLSSFSYSTGVVCRFRGEIFSIILPFSNQSRVYEKIEELKQHIDNEIHPVTYRAHMKKEQLSLAIVHAKIEQDASIDLLLKDMDKKYLEEQDVVRIAFD